MEELDPVAVFATRLNACGIPYMVTGSVASIAYGDYRHTNDVDVVLALQPGNTGRITATFPNEEFYCPPPEILREEASRPRRGHFNLIHHATGFRADCYIHTRDPLELWGYQNRRKHEYGDTSVWIAPPELVIVRKLEFYREGESPKHVEDIKSILAITDIDRAFVESHVARLGLEKEWQMCQPAN
jgi:hypothetical protein